MDISDATKIVLSRIQSFDPENALKIMGYILIQDQGEKEMIRLAFSPDTLLISYINQAKMAMARSYPIHRPPENPFPQNSSSSSSSSPRLLIPSNGPGPFPRTRPRPIPYASDLHSPNFNGCGSASPFAGDEFLGGELPFVDDSPSGNSDSALFAAAYGDDVSRPSFHRRSFSVNDAAFLDEGSGGGDGFLWKPCMYFARGFCRNGINCKFSHGDGVDAIDAGSPSNAAEIDEFMKLKALHQQRFPFIINENLRNDFSPMGLGAGANSSARQIYLTFPADSTFKEEDVSNYFSIFGPVQDVRIPYQQKRMFGFVTFVYADTVKRILAKGNPHFVCDSRVLVKPYKEKGKVREKKQHLERGEYSACLSPTGLDTREHFDHPFVPPRLMLSTQEAMLRRKMEHEAELQLELQGQRMMRVHLRDVENHNNNHHYLQPFAAGVPYSSPRPSPLLMNQNITNSSHTINIEDLEESDGGKEAAVVADEKSVLEGDKSSSNKNINGGNDSDRHDRFSAGREGSC